MPRARSRTRLASQQESMPEPSTPTASGRTSATREVQRLDGYVHSEDEEEDEPEGEGEAELDLEEEEEGTEGMEEDEEGGELTEEDEEDDEGERGEGEGDGEIDEMVDEIEEEEHEDGEDEEDEEGAEHEAEDPLASPHLKEIGSLASWTLSSAKPNCSVPQLRSDDLGLFWQSDGPQPHSINIHFAKRVFISRLRLHLDFESDESYTPTKIAVLSGTGYHDLSDVCIMNLDQPQGWIDMDLSAGGADFAAAGGGRDRIRGRGVGCGGGLKTFLVQIKILANHQNGKDTHVRGVQVFSPTYPSVDLDEVPYTNAGMLAELEIR